MKIIRVILLLAICNPCLAQEDKSYHLMPAPSIVIGGSFQKFDNLNSRVANFPQYKQLPSAMGTIELGWLKEHHRFISGAGIFIGSSMSGNRNEKSSSLRSMGVHAEIGYNLLDSKKVILYPLAGIGYEKYQAKFFIDNSAVDFNNVLQSPAVQNSIDPVSFRNSFFTYRLGMGISFRSPKYPSNSIGLQAGYVGSFSSNSWKSNDGQDLMNAPSDKLSKIYVGLVLTFSPWGMMKEMHH